MDRPALELQVLEELAAVRRELTAMRLLLPEGKLEALLAAAFTVVGADTWTVATLLEFSVDQVQGAAELRAALLRVAGARDAGAVTRLSKFLGGYAGQAFGGLQLVRQVWHGREGAVYRIERA